MQDQKRADSGKLSHVAELIFCIAYGLNGFRKINHAIGIPFWMTQYKCSFRAIASLLYGTTYNSKLSKWRTCVPDYSQVDFDAITLANLPSVSNFDAHSLLQYKTAIDHASRATDNNAAMRCILRRVKFSFVTPASATSTEIPSTTFQLSAIFTFLNFHQRVALALQIAQCMHQIFTFYSFRQSGYFVFSQKKPVLCQPIMVHGTLVSPCAYFIDAVPSTNNTLRGCGCVGKNIAQFLFTRLKRLQTLSFEPTILEPFVNLAWALRAHTPQTACKARLVPYNLTPPNIFVTFTGDLPNIVQITGWDAAEVLPANIAHCNVPGWLWGDIAPSPNGSLLHATCEKNTIHDIIRLCFIDKMEQLQPGYFQRVVASQKMHIGILGRLANHGLNLTNPADRAFYDDAFAAVQQ